jgi:site-specific DNA-methyltransferase (adenine-specific)
VSPTGGDPHATGGSTPGRGELELTWPGKHAADGSRSRPSRDVERLHLIERFPGPAGDAPNRLVAGDNLRALPALLAEFAGRVDLVYLDPPFGTGDAFHVRPPRAWTSAAHGRADGDGDASGAHSRRASIAYADREPGGLGGFIAMLAPRLELIRDLLSPTGSLYLHLDARSVHAAKLLCDEIFGASSFRNHLAWIYSGRELARRRYSAKHDDLLFYTRGRRWTFHPERILEPLRESSRRALSRHVGDDGHPYVIRYRDGGGFAVRDEPGRTYRQPVPAGTLPRDWFTADYARKSERTGYPTQKPEALLARLVAASSEPGDLVADLFAGSGTAAVVAARLGRRWLAADASPSAIATARRRLLGLPEWGGGFDVAALGDALPAAATLDVAVRRVPGSDPSAPGRARLDGSPGDLRAVAAWAIGSRDGSSAGPSDAPFVAAGAAARDPWTGELATELVADLPGPPVPDGGVAVHPSLARAWTVDGAAVDLPITS